MDEADPVAAGGLCEPPVGETLPWRDGRADSEPYRHLRRLEDADHRLALLAASSSDAAATARQQLAAIESTKVWRYSRILREVYGRLRPRLALTTKSQGDGAEAFGVSAEAYELWNRIYQDLDEERRTDLRARFALLDPAPVLSVILPVHDPPPGLLERAIESVKSQIYPHWELWIVDDASTDGSVANLLDRYAGSDPRIGVIHRTENGHVSRATNDGVWASSGTWFVCLDHDDELTAHALGMVALSAHDHADAVIIYSDEDKIDLDGRRHGPFLKPEFDTTLLLGQNYLCHLTAFRTDVVRSIGGFRPGYEGSQDWDLVLRVLDQTNGSPVVHIPHVLYHWRLHAGSTSLTQSAKPYAAEAGTRAVTDYLESRGEKADVARDPATGWHRILWPLDEHPKVSVVVPTNDGPYLERCITSVLERTEYPNYEIVVVDNGSTSSRTAEVLHRYSESVAVLRDDRPFNFSALNNRAARETSGSLLCLLNDDCEVVDGGWLSELVRQVVRPKVGVVGAKLVYPDGRLQHGGVVLGVRGAGGHVYRGSDPSFRGNFGSLCLVRTVSAVTGACMVVRREVWEEAGGLDEDYLATSFNDVDFCLRVQQNGWTVIWTPFAELIHHESVTRGLDERGDGAGSWVELEYMKARWGPALRNDSAYNPNLTLDDESGGLAWPPRKMY